MLMIMCPIFTLYTFLDPYVYTFFIVFIYNNNQDVDIKL